MLSFQTIYKIFLLKLTKIIQLINLLWEINIMNINNTFENHWDIRTNKFKGIDNFVEGVSGENSNKKIVKLYLHIPDHLRCITVLIMNFSDKFQTQLIILLNIKRLMRLHLQLHHLLMNLFLWNLLIFRRNILLRWLLWRETAVRAQRVMKKLSIVNAVFNAGSWSVWTFQLVRTEAKVR